MRALQLSRPLVILFLTLFMVMVGVGIIIPVLPFFAENMGASGIDMGLIFGSFSLMQFLFSPFWGRMSDRLGRRPILILGLVGIGLAFLMIAFARNLVELYIARILGGILSSAAMPASFAYVADSTDPSRRAQSMGLMGAAISLGLIFGPALGGFLGAINPLLPFYVAAGLAFLVAGFAYLFVSESLATKEPKRPYTRGEDFIRLWTALRSPVAFILLVGMIINIALSSLFIALPLYSERQFGFGETEMGIFFVFLGVVGAFTQGVLVGHVIRVWGEGRVAQIGLWMSGIGFFCFLLASNLLNMLLLSLMLALGSALIGTALASLISKRSGMEEQGVVMGIFTSYQSLGRIFGPLLGGFVFDKAGIAFPFVAAGILCIMTALAAMTQTQHGLSAAAEAGD